MRIEVVAAIIRRSDHILITQRLDNVHLAGRWEFPGGKVEVGESLRSALKREIREELGVRIGVHDEFFSVDHDYPGKSVRLHFFNCSILDGYLRPLGVADLRWVTRSQLRDYDFPPADAGLLARLTDPTY